MISFKKIPVITLLFIVSFVLSRQLFAQEAYPKRIISLGPAITESLYLLNAGDRIVGNTIYCERPEAAKKNEKIGTVVEINLEKIVSLEPDLIIATSLTNSQAKEKLKMLGLRVVEISQAQSFGDLCDNFIRLGEIVGQKQLAEEITATAKNEVTSLKAKTEALPKPTVFLQLGMKPLVTVTQDSFMNDYIEFAGGVNIAKGIGRPLYSKEKVAASNPDVIIVVSMGTNNAEEEKKNWESYQELKAVQKKRIYIIDSNPLCSPTPVSFVAALQNVIHLLHPDDEQ
ncbi:MAG: hypothetical protein A3G33_04370 [Omnitrophica bacterium RIFCSPLOWO2_12_FULL_44_17]|uniref:Fe/B12 periplasmic-binding domain-containing protein n=1 Tax=Candidatus Danuiimicrobium aquiferis TaxID=1801832 RepID=A0A1G1KQF4_9BACT|nr:MAG: hypothetical protein A3B72_10580 [Omnitrophica bacterium RIFCSPHIGHO2_02_FULL_45_28]OGW92460.1 MAG: hypothetical protein A3E74_03895 [Omnitrophica bacterium RIFCSPHIGHO2_12_FULL_44_12]OGW95170.1 MAG: hypothetical protein A3G33_04370 [Omnitrophica bacterium RIFCSPLOWO2_12_FULL_44_17]OGX01685.1 MAG: hypothetical protein A3J12_04065 [Omnitrophica bacterium RIFCSPLOWO2_02_FULL_44_11]